MTAFFFTCNHILYFSPLTVLSTRQDPDLCWLHHGTCRMFEETFAVI